MNTLDLLMKKNQMGNENIILGIDPGFERIGIAVIDRKENKVLFSECFKTSKALPLAERIMLIGIHIGEIISEFSPQSLAIEKLYFTTNQKTAMSVAEARGVIIYEAQKLGLSVNEYTPMEVKVAVTGYGKADKKMVGSMIPKLIKLEKETKSDDELDAIGIAITHSAMNKFSTLK